MANGIDPRRLVSHEGDVEEATREYEASKKTDASNKTDAKPSMVSHPGDVDEAAKAYADDKSKTASGVSYAEYAKNAQSAPACTSDDRENCPNDGWHIPLKVTTIRDIGTVGVETKLPQTQDDTKAGVLRVQVGLQNELSVASVTQDTKVAERNGTSVSVTQGGPSAGVHAGFHNPDGSTGLNFGVHTSAVSAGAHVDDASGASLNVEGSAGGSLGGSIGLREKHGTQICASADIGPFTVGGCLPLTHRN